MLRYRADGYRAQLPRADDVLLVIEVADTSVESDRRVKIPRYAAAGIPEAWLVNLAADRIDVYQHPTLNGYATVRSAGRGDTLTPLALHEVTLRVDDILS